MLWQRVTNQDIPLQTGDIIETSSSFIPFSTHYGIVFQKDGIQYVSHNPFNKQEGFSPRIDTLEDFKKGRRILRLIRNKHTESLTDEYIEEKSKELIDSKKYYKSLWFNCEDYIREVGQTRIGFDQRNGWVIIIVLILIIVFLGNRK